MDLRNLYQEVIIDHGKNPRNFGKLEEANHIKEGYNPLCGDKIIIYLQELDDKIIKLQFDGCGCAISMASASLMTQALLGKTLEEAKIVFHNFQQLVTGGELTDRDHLGKLLVLEGVAEYPSRVKCATLAWHTLQAAINDNNEEVSTE